MKHLKKETTQDDKRFNIPYHLFHKRSTVKRTIEGRNCSLPHIKDSLYSSYKCNESLPSPSTVVLPPMDPEGTSTTWRSCKLISFFSSRVAPGRRFAPVSRSASLSLLEFDESK